ncbi:gluconokinase [Streptacidiphilus jiangxiensis]|uniref:Gluconokinase n=1 Tax=Streptacidiphilus jiangxiensis TaxID=235985 RepID=A0A1H7UDC5_STRJI|nr:gluconokinase [Streptacidiphilus jiangxiensis]SEL94809.1 gluconokinase [Streptacidiphilus jiangxiensis]
MALSVENQRNQRPAGPAPAIVVMGVAGVGKTTVAMGLAERLGLPYGEADDFHPAANIAKMAAGIPLDDADREPWLRAIGAWLAERVAAGTGGVVTCSALKRSYRDLLRDACPDAFFLHLTGAHALVEERLAHRSGHFMKAYMLDSQLAILEPLTADENGAALDVGPTPESLVESAVALLPRPVNGDLA